MRITQFVANPLPISPLAIWKPNGEITTRLDWICGYGITDDGSIVGVICAGMNLTIAETLPNFEGYILDSRHYGEKRKAKR